MTGLETSTHIFEHQKERNMISFIWILISQCLLKLIPPWRTTSKNPWWFTGLIKREVDKITRRASIWCDPREIVFKKIKWIFYHSVAQCLFISLRAQRYAKTTTVLLSTYIQEPHEVDRGKLKRILKYFRWKIYLPCIMRAYSLNIVNMWVGASYATHLDCRLNTVQIMSLGKGATIIMSNK